MIHFEGRLPNYLTSIGGRIATTPQQHKYGLQSLKWTYQEGAQLHFKTPIGYAPIQDGHLNQMRYASQSIYLDLVRNRAAEH